MPLHADQAPASRMAGDAILRAGEIGWLTTANVQAATTLVSVQALISAGSGHADQAPLKSRINSLLDIGGADATLSTTNIGNATSVSNLAAFTEVDELGRSYGGVA